MIQFGSVYRNSMFASWLVIFLILSLAYGCGGHKTRTAAEPVSPPAPPIYEDVSRFERPPCSTPELSVSQGRLCGNLIGTSNGKAVSSYLGIPFAETTAGDNRWRAPVPKKPWEGVYRATRLGPACPQTDETTYPQSEDCLSINVWTPADPSDSPRAVMVFIYGGAFIYGYNAEPLYDGAYTAGNGDVVVVSLNYRVGALGFLSGIRDTKTGEAVNGNFGILDQILALKWVQDNIGAFGGDPARVTIYGESAGAMSVGIHLVSSPESGPLFRAGIMESNPLGLPYKSLKQSHAIAKEFASNLGCAVDDVACMRGMPAEVVLDGQLQMDMGFPALFHGIRDMLVWSPVIDGKVITEQPIKAINKGKLTKPAVMGSNRNEGLLFVEVAKAGLKWKKVSDFDYRLVVDFFFRDHSLRKKIYAKYTPGHHDNTTLISNLFTDYLFICPTIHTASQGSPETWSYLFDHVPSFNSRPQFPDCGKNVCHTAELAFVFHTSGNIGHSFTPEEEDLSDLMVAYWTGFAKNLDPNPDRIAWPPFSPGASSLIFVTPVGDIKPESGPPDICAFWDGIGYDLKNSFWGLF